MSVSTERPPSATGPDAPTSATAATQAPVITPRPAKLRPTALRLNVRGRSIPLRGLRQPPPGILRWLFLLGPGLVAAVAGDDAGGIATYSSVGASYGYDLLWVLLLVTISLAVVQELAARLGAATGRGLLGLIREGEGVAAAVLTNLNVDLEDIQQKIEETVKKGKAAAAAGPDLPYTSRAKKVLELAMTEARELNHSYVGTEHLLLGLLR